MSHLARKLLMSSRVSGEIRRKGHVADGRSFFFLAKLFVRFHEMFADDCALYNFPGRLQILLGTRKIAGAEFNPAKGVPICRSLQHERKIGRLRILWRY